MDEALAPKVRKLDDKEPDFSKTGFWAPGAVLVGHQMCLNGLGRRHLAAVGPCAEELQAALIERLAASDWASVESAIFDLVDSLSLDGETDRRGREQLWLALLNIIEARPRSFEELGIIVLREKLRIAIAANFRLMTHSEFVPQIERSERAFNKMSHLFIGLTEDLRRQRTAGSESRVVVAVSQNAQSVANAVPPAATQTGPLKYKSSSGSGSINGQHAAAAEGDSPLDRLIDSSATSDSGMREAAE